MARDVNSETFEEEVLQADKPVLIDFWGPQCGPCLALMPAVEQLAERHKDKLKLVKLDASKNKRFCLSMKVRGLPTFLLFKDGKEVNRLTGGELTIEKIESALKSILT